MSCQVRRRKFLTTSGAVSLAVLAGCSSPSSTGGNTQIPAADLPSEYLNQNGWRKTADRTGQVFEENYLAGLVTVTANQHTVIYEDQQLQITVKERTLDNVDTTLRTFFATRTDLDPNLDNLPLGVGLGQILDKTKSSAKDSFEEQLRNAGLSGVSVGGEESLKVVTGETAGLFTYDAQYRYESIRIPVPEADNITIPAGSLTITGLLAVWHHGDYILVSGGVYPAEDFEERVSTEITEAITVTVDIDLGFRPARYKRDLLQLMKSVR